MKDIVIIVVCLWALSLVWHGATAALGAVFDMPTLTSSALVGFVGGLLFSFLLAYAWIYNSLVEADRRRAHEKVDKDHDGRRI